MFCGTVCADGRERSGVRQVFAPEAPDRINVAVREKPQWARADLARRVCDSLGGAPTTERQSGECRVALVRLVSAD